MRKAHLGALALVTALSMTTADQPVHASDPLHAGELAHALDRVGKTGRVLYIAAHPDDENTRLLTWLANARHLTVAYLSMTRGGGGQNLIGPEQGELLDVIRTEELLAARRLDGAEQRFTRMRDFGYSKSADETFAKWDREEALADVVWVIRSFQPDVIITRFGEQPPNHGHHTASAILAREAFSAAADAKRFPDQLERGVTVWKADRLLHNWPTWSGAPAAPEGTLELDVGGYDPRTGLDHGELAARSRSQHKSQGFGVPGERGKLVERFVPLAGTKPKNDLLEGLALGWERYGKKGAAFELAINEAAAALTRDTPHKAVPLLIKAHGLLDALPDEPRVRDARRSLERVIVLAAGLYVRATAPSPVGVPGDTVEVTVEIVARSPAQVSADGTAMKKDEKRLVTRKLPVPDEISTPYWLALPPLAGRYPVNDPRLVGAPRGAPALTTTVDVAIAGKALKLVVPVVHSWTDAVHGERVRDFVIAPPATVTPARDAVMFPNGKGAAVQVRVRAAKAGVKVDVALDLPAGWKATPRTIPVVLAGAGDETTVTFTVKPPAGATAAVDVRPAITVDGRAWAFREDVIDHPHIPLQLVLQPASVRLAPVELKLPRGTVGYVRGPGDSVAADLAHVGVKVEDVDDETLRGGDLDRYAAIVLGVRALNTRAAARGAHARLLDYAKRGGTVVVQYNTNSRLAPLTAPIGPCDLTIGRDRITDEDAPVTHLLSKHASVRVPNLIGPDDWKGWVQERGIYFATSWGKCWKPLFELADPGEKPLEGSTLVADHGKGRFVYTGLAFFRQLPAGVPGAYRLFANLIARR